MTAHISAITANGGGLQLEEVQQLIQRHEKCILELEQLAQKLHETVDVVTETSAEDEVVTKVQSQPSNESTVVGKKGSNKQANKESKKNTDVEEDTDVKEDADIEEDIDVEKEKKKEEEEKKDQQEEPNLLNDFPCLSSFLKFSNSAQFTAREYWKPAMSEKPVPTGDETTIPDVENVFKKDDPEPNRDGSAEAKDDNSPNIPAFTLALGVDRDTSHAKININDPELNTLMQILLAHYPGYGPDIPKISFTMPFEPIVQSWDSLMAVVSEGKEQRSALLDLKERLESMKTLEPGMPKALREFANDEQAQNRARRKLRLLLELTLQVIKATPSEPNLSELLLGSGLSSPKNLDTIVFEQLWTLFTPGDVVISKSFLGEAQAFIVNESLESSIESPSRWNRTRYWSLTCWAYDWTGTTFRRVPVELRVNDFRGARKIESLAVFPLKYLPSEKWQELIERGKRFRELCIKPKGSHLHEYSGDAILRGTGVGQVNLARASDGNGKGKALGLLSFLLDEHLNSADFSSISTVEIESGQQVMVDASSFRRLGPGVHYSGDSLPIGELRVRNKAKECHCTVCSSNTILKDTQKAHYDLDPSEYEKDFEDAQYALCPPRVLGFHVAKKSWVELKVTNVKDISQRTDSKAFENLQLAKPHKDLLRKLVASHWSKQTDDARNKMVDLMKGKGEGLIVLLYGPPGVGKTLTAESVAKASGRPLISVSVADFGLEPETVDANLDRVFKLAATWEAIVLIDEADVFLESRSITSLQRNALVSVLLRVLEYYDGILILTTNRLKTFDHAVMSRVNLPIKYQPLDDKGKKNIFRNLLRNLDDDGVSSKRTILEWLDDEESDAMQKFKSLNGRQIRNVLFSATRMAVERESAKLELEDIKKLAGVMDKFEQDIRVDMELSRQRNEPGLAYNQP